jgi:hypothetical protein
MLCYCGSGTNVIMEANQVSKYLPALLYDGSYVHICAKKQISGKQQQLSYIF